MSLRHQINLRILLLSLVVMALGGGIAVWQARSSVSKEIEASVNLAVQLVALGFGHNVNFNQASKTWLPQLTAFKATRHLHIQLRTPAGQIVQLTPPYSIHHHSQAPNWFVHLASPTYPYVERQIVASDGQVLTLIISANPLDEVSEAWQESLYFFACVLALALFTFLAINILFDHALKSISTIIGGLRQIEQGNFQQPLPRFNIIELDRIAKAIDHLSGQLYASQLKNHALTQHSLAIQEAERKKLAQELHDELSQSLTAIKIMLAALPKGDTPKIAATISGVCDHLIHIVRSMMHQLHPIVLSDLGLKAAIDDLIQHWTKRNPSLKLEFIYDQRVDQVGQQLTIQLFRIVQECLTNINRHAQASHASITLSLDAANTVQLLVSDNGKGCANMSVSRGFGLLSMKDRVNSLGGQLILHSQPQQGFHIHASIPL